jgi:hypothetical protein
MLGGSSLAVNLHCTIRTEAEFRHVFGSDGLHMVGFTAQKRNCLLKLQVAKCPPRTRGGSPYDAADLDEESHGEPNRFLIFT